jgi:hypothetical protein
MKGTPMQGNANGPYVAPSGGDSAAGEILDNVGESIRKESADVVKEVKERGKAIIDEQLDVAAGEVGIVAEVLQRAADELAGKNSRFAAYCAACAATGLADVSQTLRNNDIASLVQSTERVAARNPAVFMGVTVAAGFLLGRFLLSSGHRTSSEQPSSPGADGMYSDTMADDRMKTPSYRIP